MYGEGVEMLWVGKLSSTGRRKEMPSRDSGGRPAGTTTSKTNHGGWDGKIGRSEQNPGKPSAPQQGPSLSSNFSLGRLGPRHDRAASFSQHAGPSGAPRSRTGWDALTSAPERMAKRLRGSEGLGCRLGSATRLAASGHHGSSDLGLSSRRRLGVA